MRTVSALLLSLLVLSSPVVEGSLGQNIWEFFNEVNTATTEEANATTPLLNNELGLVLSPEQIALGQRGFSCLRQAANVPTDPFEDLGLLQGPFTRILLTMYGEDGVNRLCSMTPSGRALLAKDGPPASTSTSTNTNTNTKTRDMQETQETSAESCAASQATFPADPRNDPNKVYADYAAKYFDKYLPNGDRSQRSDNDKVVQLVQGDLNYFRGVRANLNRCVNLWSGVNEIIGLVDVPIIDQDKISESIMSFTCGLSQTYNDILISRNERHLERIAFHDQVIHGAEIASTYINTKAMMANMCSFSDRLVSASNDMSLLMRSDN
jgi:hypothetical protein